MITYYKIANKSSPRHPILYKINRNDVFCWQYIAQQWSYWGRKKEFVKYSNTIKYIYNIRTTLIDESYVFLKIFENENSLINSVEED